MHIPKHTLEHALEPVKCDCTREELRVDCVACHCNYSHFSDEAKANGRDTCGRFCRSKLLDLQRSNVKGGA